MKLKLLPQQFDREALAELLKTSEDQLKEADLKKHHFKYKEYKKHLEKDLIKAKKSMVGEEEASIAFYLSTEYSYTDKGDMPLLIVGNPAGAWKPFLKKRIKEHKSTDATGTFQFDDSDKAKTGISYLELSIERGKAKPKIIKKLMDKWLMPSGVEIKFAEVQELEDEDDQVPQVQPRGDELVELDPNDKVQAYFLAWQEGRYTGKEEQTMRLKIKQNLDQWVAKYDLLKPEQKTMPLQTKRLQYDFMLRQLEKAVEGSEENTEEEVVAGIVVSNGDGRTTLSEIDLGQLTHVPQAKDSNNYAKIYKTLQAFNAEQNIDRKRQLFDAGMSMVKKWVEHHKKDRISTSKTKQQLREFAALYKQYQPFLEQEGKGKIDTRQKEVHKDTSSRTGTKTLFDATAGDRDSSEQAKDVRDATVDDRAMRLAEYLQRGKASNDDKTFGAVMKWLADNPEQELRDKYAAATRKKFKKESDLIGDMFSVFGAQTLRSRYLIDKLNGKESPYAKLAFTLGLMGETWFDTIEREDAMTVIESQLSAGQIKAIWAASDKTTFEGAINAYLSKSHKNMKAQIEKHTALLEARENGDQQQLKTANEEFLNSMIHRLRKEGRFGKKLNKQDFYDNFQRWYDKASDEEREAMLDEESEFMKNLRDLTGKLTYSGLDKGDLAFIQAKLKAPKEPPKGKETNVVFDQLEAIVSKQETKSTARRWMENKDIGEQFKATLFDKDVKDPQRAVVAKFATDEELKQWDELEQQINETDGDTTDLEKQRATIFNRAYGHVQSLMSRAGVHSDYQKQITETLNSNGAKGKIYQKLVKLAKANFTYDFGEDVQKLIGQLDPNGAEMAAIRADEDLLRILQARTLGSWGLEDNKKEWRTIVNQLGLTGDLAKEELSDEQRKAQKDEGNFKRKNRKSRAKLQTKKQLDQQKEQTKDQKTKPEFWASRISYEYERGYFSRDGHRILQMMFEAQRAGVNINDILDRLEDIDADALGYIQTKDSYACKTIMHAANNGNQPISAREMLLESRESVRLKRQVKASEVEDLVKLLKPEELIQEMFDWEALRKAIDQKKLLLDQLKEDQDDETRQQRQTELQEVETRIQRFDIAPSFLEDLDNVLPPQKALEVKQLMRDKVGNALTAEGDNPTKKLLVDMKVLSDGDIRLLGTSIKAISNLEKEKQSETGLQWSSLSSRMLQRDLATANYLTKNWERNERLTAMNGVIDPEELEQEKQELVEGLNKTEEELQEAIQKFEERKAQYDDRMKQIINALAQAVFFTLTMASGVGAAAGVVQLVWALASTFMQTTISETLNMITAGDRSGGMREKAEDFFFTALADQAGAITGLVGANLAFALDVKAIGTFSQAKGSDGKALLGAWDNILRTPFLKTATGLIRGTFEDIGKNFVKNLTDEKESMFSDPIGNFKEWGIKTIQSLPKRYLKALLMTTAATSVGAIADKLGWDKSVVGYHNPDSAGKNQYTANGENRPFAPDDARLGFFGTDSKNFEGWFNSWGMFDASPTFGGAQWNGDSDPFKGLLQVFESAGKNLQDPKVLIALGNSMVWGSMDGSSHGIKQQLGGLVEKSFKSLKNYQNVDLSDEQREQLKQGMLKQFDEAMDAKTSEVINILQRGYEDNNNISLEDVEAGAFEPHVILDIWETMNWIGDGGNATHNTEFFDVTAKALGITSGEMRLLRRDPECRPFNSIREYRDYYESSRSAYTKVFANTEFVDHYLEVRSHDGTHPKEVRYTIQLDDAPYTATKELEDDLNSIYAQWEELADMEAEERELVF